MFAFGDPLLKEGAVRGGLGGGDAAVVKAEGAGLGDEGGFELLRGELEVVGDGLRWVEPELGSGWGTRGEFTAWVAGWLLIRGRWGIREEAKGI